MGADTGVHGGYYFSALDAYYNVLELTVSISAATELAETARSTFRPYTTIAYRDEQAYASPCTRNICYEPIKEPDILKKFLVTPVSGEQ